MPVLAGWASVPNLGQSITIASGGFSAKIGLESREFKRGTFLALSRLFLNKITAERLHNRLAS